jgi:hypothetical protein
MGVLTLMRDLMIDDHGPDLHLLPAIGDELFYPQNPMHFPPLHSIWGTADLKMYRFKQNRMAYILTMPTRRDEPELLLVHLPAGKTVRKVMSEVGGVGRLMPDGSIATVIDPLFTIGVNIVVRLEDGTADTDEDEDDDEDQDGAHEPPEAGALEDGGFR